MCVEVPASHIHIWNLKANSINCIPWDGIGENKEFSVDHWWTMLHTQQSLSDEEFYFEYNHSEFDENVRDQKLFLYTYIKYNFNYK